MKRPAHLNFNESRLSSPYWREVWENANESRLEVSTLTWPIGGMNAMTPYAFYYVVAESRAVPSGATWPTV